MTVPWYFWLGLRCGSWPRPVSPACGQGWRSLAWYLWLGLQCGSWLRPVSLACGQGWRFLAWYLWLGLRVSWSCLASPSHVMGCCSLARWYLKRRIKRYFGPGYSSDNAGDGPSEDEDEDDDDLSLYRSGDSDEDSDWRTEDSEQTSTASGNSDNDSVVLYSACLWPIEVIERYLRENDFSIMITYAYEFWDRSIAKRQLDLLSLATWTAIQA